MSSDTWFRQILECLYLEERELRGRVVLTLILLMWRTGWAHNNARK